MHNSPKGGKQYINLFSRKQHETASKTKTDSVVLGRLHGKKKATSPTLHSSKIEVLKTQEK